MTTSQLSTKVDGIVSKAEKAFGSQVNTTQKALFEQMQLLLNRLDLNPDGTIIQSQANRSILSKTEQYYEKAFKQSGYYDSLNSFSSSVSALTSANDSYFSDLLGDTFTIDAQYLKSLQKQTISQLEGLLANDGLEAMVKQPITNILNQNINTGASYTDLLKQIREFTLGTPELQGKLAQYSGQITRDSLFNFSRSIQESVSQNSGLEWCAYVGGSMADSRPFCLERIGKYYKKDDVEKWANLKWAGKRAGTTKSTIFIYAGGYNCRHQIIYVSEEALPNIKGIRKITKEAKDVGEELQSKATKIADKYGAKITPINYKSKASTFRKVQDELNGDITNMKDATRNTIVTDGKNIKDVANEAGKLGYQGLKIQNFTDTGYRGYISNPRLSNGLIGEIQINTPEMIFAKEEPSIAKAVIGEDTWKAIQKKTGMDGGLGHKYYEEIRKLQDPSNPLVSDLKRKSREYYEKFYYSYPKNWP